MVTTFNRLDDTDILDRLQPLQFNTLPDINNIDSISTEDKACLEELKSVLIKHNLVSKFGIALLHNHFHLEDDEVLLEYCDKEKRQLISKPVKTYNLASQDVIETLWRFNENDIIGGAWCKKYCPRDAKGKHYGYKEHEPGEV
ncbi:MAG: hypothetical protein F6K10_04395 [Moorea sp. SIO2B7]|nr:hypothetical protein [Moorena sp. SIO2B7]